MLGDPVNFIDPTGEMTKVQVVVWAIVTAMKIYTGKLPPRLPELPKKPPIEKPKKKNNPKDTCDS